MKRRFWCAVWLTACVDREGATSDSATGALPAHEATVVSSHPAPSTALSAGPQRPALVWASPAASTARADATVADLSRARLVEVARSHLTGGAAGGRYMPARVAQLALRELHDTGAGAIVARFQRRVGGLEVFGQQVAVALDRGSSAVALSGELSGALGSAPGAASSRPKSAATVTPERAVRLAIEDAAGVRLDSADVGAGSPLPGGYERFALARGALAKLSAAASTAPARVREVLYPAARKQLVHAYYVEADSGHDAAGRPRYFAHVISASEGAVLWKRDLVANEAYTYRVYADDAGLFTPWDGPQGTAASPHATGEPGQVPAPAFVSSQLVTLSSLSSVGVEDPWLPPGAVETSGNNVDAYLDISAPDGFTAGSDLRGELSSPGVFGAVFDPTRNADLAPTQRMASVTQLFYDINWLHDWYYAAGFNEAAGNAQRDNYGRGGVEGDAILAEAQDIGNVNNALMITPADGMSPRMQMYLWQFGAPQLSFDGPEPIAGQYAAGPASFSPLGFDVSGPLVRAEPSDGCSPLIGDYAGAVVLLDRGGDDCGQFAFATKAANAQAAGAAGVVIANVASSSAPALPANPIGEAPFPITIGVVAVNLADGDRLRAALGEGSAIEVHMSRDAMLRDGALDSEFVAHEWGHYISNRLVLDGAGLGTQMAGGLGEGWGDFHTLLMIVRPEDATRPGNEDWSGAYPIGSYASESSSSDGYYFGKRRFPYSTDMRKDPLTFRHLSNAAPLPDDVPNAGDSDHTQLHNMGEVWASMLWECYAALLRDTLGPSPRLSFARARDRMRDYLVASYKLTPPNPTLLEARDALLAVALASDSIDAELFARAFARRGAGVFAVAPDRFDATNSGIVESYAAGAAVTPVSVELLDDVAPACEADGILDSGEIGTLRVTFRNIGNAPSAAITAELTTSVPGVSFPNGGTLDVRPLPLLGEVVGSVSVALAGLSGITPVDFSVRVADAGAGELPAVVYLINTNADELPRASFTDGAESSHVVWSAPPASDPAAPERWQRAELSPTTHVYHGAAALAAATVDLVSPPLRTAPDQPFSISFLHRFSFESDGQNHYDGGVVEVSTDAGQTWMDVGESLGYGGPLFSDSSNPLGGRAALVGASPAYPEFVPARLDLGLRYAGETLQVRFRIASDLGTSTPGWDLDEIAATGVLDPPFDRVTAQSEHCSLPVDATQPELVDAGVPGAAGGAADARAD